MVTFGTEADPLKPNTLAHRVALALLVAAASSGCYDFNLIGPETSPEVNPPRTVEVTVEYRQPNGCLNDPARCDDLVVFFGSWMSNGDALFMQRIPGSHVWRVRARGVPVNFPPRDEPYLVRVFDPHLVQTETGGVTGSRIEVGDEALQALFEAGTPRESALVYVDENGSGHNPL
jgi:hypothetical protein